MRTRSTISDEESAALSLILRAGNYKAVRIELSLSEVMDNLKLGTRDLVRVLRGLADRGLVRLIRLPRATEEIFIGLVREELDALDFRYLEDGLPESEYVSSRKTLADQLSMTPEHAEPIPPLEAAKLFLRLNLALERLLILKEPSQLSQSSELPGELLHSRDTLLPFREFIRKRISELTSKKKSPSDPRDEKRMRMMLLFSQVGMSRLTNAKEIAQDLLDELDVLEARYLLEEVSQTDLMEKKEALVNEISKRMTPQPPADKDFTDWVQVLNSRLESLRTLSERGVVAEYVSKALSKDLSEDIGLIKSHISS